MLVRNYSEKEAQLKLRTKEPSEKDVLFKNVQQLFLKSKTIDDFRKHLKEADIKTYDRNNKLCGVYFGKRKYRIKRSLGIDLDILMIKDKSQEREQSIRKLRKKQNRNKSRER